MIRPSVKDLIVALSLATLNTLAAPTASGDSLDACGSLGAKQGIDVTYADVANCYKSIPFDNKNAASTMETVVTLFNDHYIFRDSALTPNLQSPFSSPPIDIIKQLKSIAGKPYANDLAFHTAIYDTLNSLNDGHVEYKVECYRNYKFTQPLLLYAPVVDGKQSILVYIDTLNRGYEDCVVESINGQDAMTYLTQWHSAASWSKDAGVRLNQILATQYFSQEDGGMQVVAGDFAERLRLPEAPYIDYKIQCKGSAKPMALREKWKVVNMTDATTFRDTKEYVANVCLAASSSQANHDGNQVLRSNPPGPRVAERPKRSVFLRFLRTPSLKDATVNLTGADLIMEAKSVIFYRLKDHPKVGVLVVPAHDPSRNGLQDLVNGLTEFHKRNVTNVIIDLQGNSGGIVAFAYNLVQAFFPNKGQFDISLPMDLRASNSTQKLAAALFENKWGSPYDAASYINYENKTPYRNADMFTQPVRLTRNGRTDFYSQLSISAPFKEASYPQLDSFPWTNKPHSIHILTDGRCGSACALSAHIFSKIMKVPVTAVGGIKDKPLSKFTFAGGVVGDLAGTLERYDRAKVNTSMTPLPYEATIDLPVAEVYAHNGTIPLEYDAAAYTADVHMDFDPKNARNRVTMWGQVAAQAWNF
ncbi:hypothetical protein BGZ72_000594 [Mortierella alpina]|nr:hypothetical protein BGZ72_000594 [Mortierella alpina]